MRRLLLLAALLAAAASTAGAAPQRAEHDCVRGGELFFNAADGTKLVGHRFGKGTTAVILTHQSEGDLCDWLPYAKRLAARATSPSRSTSAATASPTSPSRAVPVRAGHRGRREGAAQAREAEDLRRRRLDGRDRRRRRRRERDAAARRRRQRLLTGALPRHGRRQGRPAAARAGALPRGDRGRQRRLRLLGGRGGDLRAAASKDKRLELLPGAAHGIGLVASSTTRESLDREAFLKGH